MKRKVGAFASPLFSQTEPSTTAAAAEDSLDEYDHELLSNDFPFSSGSTGTPDTQNSAPFSAPIASGNDVSSPPHKSCADHDPTAATAPPQASPFFSSPAEPHAAPGQQQPSGSSPGSRKKPRISRDFEDDIMPLPADVLGAFASRFSYSPPEGGSGTSRRTLRRGDTSQTAIEIPDEVAPTCATDNLVNPDLETHVTAGGEREGNAEPEREGDKVATQSQTQTAAASSSPQWLQKSPRTSQEPPKLSPEQQRVLDLVEEGKNIFFTGCAGTGKSFVLKEIIRRHPSTHVTAMTGMAALGIGGETLHKFAGIGLGEGPKEKLLELARNSKTKKRNWTTCRKLIIDEISMLDAGLFEKLDYIGRTIRNVDRPFGGIQLILSGDFFQLPPVSASGKIRLCFQSSLWKELFDRSNMVELKKVFRQEEKEFIEVLNEVRFNKLSEATVEKLKNLQRPLDRPNGIIPTKLYSTNMDVDSVNERFLQELPGDVMPFVAKDYGPAQEFEKLFMAQKNLILKVGAQVMLLKNLESRLVNGSRGIVDAFEPELDSYGREVGEVLPVVRFLNGERRRIARSEWKIEIGQGSKVVTRVQVPLKLAWAVTIHKSQGLTIDFLEVDLGGVFEYGQAYVALSRARTLQGLRVSSFSPSRIRSHPEVIAFYENLVEQSLTPEERKERAEKKAAEAKHAAEKAKQEEAKKQAAKKEVEEVRPQAPQTPRPLTSSFVPLTPPLSGMSKIPVKVTKVYSSLLDPKQSVGLSDFAKKPLEAKPISQSFPSSQRFSSFQSFSSSQALLPPHSPPPPLPKKRPSSLQDPFKNLPQPQEFVKKPLELDGSGFTKASDLLRKPNNEPF